MVKQLGLSQLIHVIQSIGLKQKVIKEIEKIFFAFLWKSNSEKNTRVIERVKRETLCNELQMGGLCMINIVAFQQSFFLGWAEELMCIDFRDWKTAAIDCLRCVGGRAAFHSNLRAKDFKGLNNIKNSFWQLVLRTWLDHRASITSDPDKLTENTPLLNNKNIRYKNSVLFFRELIDKGIVYVKDLILDNLFVTYDYFKTLLNHPKAILIYNCLYNALKRVYPFLFHSTQVNLDYNEEHILTDNEYIRVGRKTYYKSLRPNSESYIENYWSRVFQKPFEKKSWMVAFDCTKEVRLQELHWKILMKIYPTSIMLTRMKIKRSDLCEHCGIQDTLQHFFFYCKKSHKLWEEIQSIISLNIYKNAILNVESIIFGVFPSGRVTQTIANKINLLILLGKLSISKSKYGSRVNPIIIFQNELSLRQLYQ